MNKAQEIKNLIDEMTKEMGMSTEELASFLCIREESMIDGRKFHRLRNLKKIVDLMKSVPGINKSNIKNKIINTRIEYDKDDDEINCSLFAVITEEEDLFDLENKIERSLKKGI